MSDDIFLKEVLILPMVIEDAFYFKAADGTKRAAIVEGPRHGPCVVLCHGHWGADKNSKTNVLLSEALNRIGVVTYRFDFKGHGESEGDKQYCSVGDGLSDLEEAWCNLVTRNDVDLSRLALFGSSFGGMVAGLFAAENPLCKGVALKSSTIEIASLLKDRAAEAYGGDANTALRNWEQNGILELEILGEKRKLDYSVYSDAISRSLLRYAPQMECPILFVHGRKDEVVPLSEIERVYALINSEKALKLFDEPHKFSDVANAQAVKTISEFYKRLFEL